MSPEQLGLGGSDVDTRTDVYSLGALLYELLCGGTVFGLSSGTGSYTEMQSAILHKAPTPPSKQSPDEGGQRGRISYREDSSPGVRILISGQHPGLNRATPAGICA